MPIYGYACKNCDHQFDALQKIADDLLVDCPACDEPLLKRQLSAPRFRLKGKGWYETDFKKDNQRNLAGDTDPAKADKKTDEKADKKTDEKADKKTDEKADKKADKKSEAKSTVKSTSESSSSSSRSKAKTA
ncbi:MAG: zinc ribbon domain-containing protein [Proteobacteria bacterium]|nr:zinc ribbon domain-containing protein [Pseudomonadota bacterium]